MALRFINRHKEGLLVCSGVLATLYGGMVLWKDNLKGGKLGQLTENEAPKDRKRVYVVTGANSGLNDKILYYFGHHCNTFVIQASEKRL